MPALKVLAFDGIVPRQSPTTLADNQAQAAENVKLYSQELRPWRGPSLVYTPALSNIQTIYRMYNAGGASVWLTWATDVDVAPGPIADISEARVYYTGDVAPRKTNYAMASSAAPYPTAYQDLGVAAPTAAPTLAASPNGTGTAETRAYVYTLVNDFGSVREESAPSPPASITINPTGAGVLINGFSAVPAGTYNFTARRIYRTVPGSSTVTYQFVAEIAIGATSYTDTLATVSLGAAIETIGWAPPPVALKGMIAMPGSGSLAGFVGNTVYMSEPFFPHAWPLAYALNVPYPIIGIAPLGTSIVVMTDTYPYLLNGGTPGQMQTQRIDILEPCVAKSTIVTNEDGVTYASPNGLVTIGPSTRGVITGRLYTRDEWAKVLPIQMKSAMLDGRYFGVFPNETNASRALVLNRDNVPALSNLTVAAKTLHVDSKNAALYFLSLSDNKIYQLDADDVNPLSYEWRSKRWVLPVGTVFSALRLDADYAAFGDTVGYNANVAAIIAANQAAFGGNLLGAMNEGPLNVFTVNGSILKEVPTAATNRNVQVIIYGDGAPVANVSPTSLDPLRLPPFKSRELEFRILGNVNVRSIHIASTVAELKQ